MKLARIVIALAALAAPASARAGEVFGFVDSSRAYSEATEPKRLLSEVQQDFQAKQREIQAAQQAVESSRAKKAKPADVAALEEKARKLSEIDQADYDKHREQVASTLRKHFAAVCDRLRAENHLAHILNQLPLDTAPDLTDEAIRRWNASDVDGIASELQRKNAELAAENARLKAEKAELIKPVAPSVPPPPPIQPVASKAKK